MSIKDFILQANEHVKLGEALTQIFFMYDNGHYVPAILCMEMTEYSDSQDTMARDRLQITAITGIIYCKYDTGNACRVNYGFEDQKKFLLPIIVEEIPDEDYIEMDEDSDQVYYQTCSEMLNALECGNVSEAQKKKYLSVVQPGLTKELLELVKKIFPQFISLLGGE